MHKTGSTGGPHKPRSIPFYKRKDAQDVKKTGKYKGMVTEKNIREHDQYKALTDRSIFGQELSQLQKKSKLAKKIKEEKGSLQDSDYSSKLSAEAEMKAKKADEKLNNAEKAYQQALVELSILKKLLPPEQSSQRTYLDNVLIPFKGNLDTARHEAQEAYQEYDEVIEAINISNEATAELEEAGPTAYTAMKLGIAVDAYKKAILDLINLSKHGSPPEVNNANINVNAKIDKIKALFNEISKSIGGVDRIESQIQTIDNQIKKLREAPKTNSSHLAMLRGKRKGLENLKAALEYAKNIAGQKDIWEKSIAKKGVDSEYFKDILEQIKRVTEDEKEYELEPLMLGIQTSVEHCAEELNDIDAILAAQKGLSEFKRKNDKLLEKLKNLKSKLYLFAIGNLVVIFLEWYYNKKGKAAEKLRQEANQALDKLLSSSNKTITQFKIIEEKEEEILQSDIQQPDIGISLQINPKIKKFADKVQSAESAYNTAKKISETIVITRESSEKALEDAREARQNVWNAENKLREAKLQLILEKRNQNIDLSLEEQILEIDLIQQGIHPNARDISQNNILKLLLNKKYAYLKEDWRQEQLLNLKESNVSTEKERYTMLKEESEHFWAMQSKQLPRIHTGVGSLLKLLLAKPYLENELLQPLRDSLTQLNDSKEKISEKIKSLLLIIEQDLSKNLQLYDRPIKSLIILILDSL